MGISLFSACSNEPEYAIHDQVLTWPILDEVTDLRSQLAYDGLNYIVATDKSIYRISDTLPDTKPLLEYTFQDSLWYDVCLGLHPDDTIKKPEEINHDFFRGMPDFLISKIVPIDPENVFIILAFNSISAHTDGSGSSVNNDYKFYNLNYKTHILNEINLDRVYIDSIPGKLLFCRIDRYSNLQFVKQGNRFDIYSPNCFYDSGPHSSVRSDELLHYSGISNSGNIISIDSISDSEPFAGQLLVDRFKLYQYNDESINHVMDIDTTLMNGRFILSAYYDPALQLTYLYTGKYEEAYQLHISTLDKKGKETIISTINEAQLIGNELYPNPDEKSFIIFYEREAQIHQQTIRFK